MRILALDTCGKTSSVSVYDEKIVGEVYIDTEQTHSVTLLPTAEWLVNSLGLKMTDFDYIASTVGPGSFTGVRIGMSAAKGIASGLGVKCIGVSSLMAAAYGAKDADALVCSVMDARCAQVYNANFMVDNDGIKRLCEDRALAIADLFQELKNNYCKILFIGDGAHLCYDYFIDNGYENCKIANEGFVGVCASNVALAAKEFVNDAVEPEKFAVNYIRLSQAERELAKKNGIRGE